MAARFGLAFTLAFSFAMPAMSQTTIVNETFDSYADQAAFDAVWRPDDGNGNTPLGGPTGLLIPGNPIVIAPPNDNPPDIQGKAVNIFNDINEYIGPATAQMATLAPTATQAVRLTGDFFDHASGNKRASIGMRNKTTPSNLIEIGMYNANDTDPITGAPEISTHFAYRVILFGGPVVGGTAQPNWGYFPLNSDFDRLDDLDTVVNTGDIGAGWHKYTATVSLTEVTLTLDLFRDGLTNTVAAPGDRPVAGTGINGVDSTVTWQIAPAGAPDPFNSLRIGAPSGITSPNESVVDNIKLELVDIVAPPGDDADFDGDGDVDGQDFLTWQRGLGGPGDLADGDANDDGNVTAADLEVWKQQFGVPAAPVIGAVPEPATLALAAAAMLAGLAAARRR